VKEDTTHGLNPEQLARLLALGLQNSNAQGDLDDSGTPANVLKEMLATKLPLDPALPDSLPALLKRPCDDIAAAAGRTLRDLLLDSTTDLAVIKTLKDYGKELVRCGGPDAKQAAATVIYYAAIASALAFHQHKISRHSYERLQEAYADLAQKPWIPSDLKNLFKRAHTACQQRTPKRG